jgi:hypothetical protein
MALEEFGHQKRRRALDRLALNAAQTTAQRGDVALTRLRYLDAAQRFAEAAVKVPQGHEDERWKYLNEEADALYQQGDEFGDNAAALSAIERYRRLAGARPRNVFPRDWAMTQMHLGKALETLGEREGGTARSKRPSPPITKPCRKGPASTRRLIGP